MSTIAERLDYATSACRKRGLAPLIWRLSDHDFAELEVQPDKSGRAFYNSIPVERSQSSFSSCLTHAAHGATVSSGELGV